MTYATGGLAAPLGWPVMAHGLDHFFTGMSHQTSNLIDGAISMGGGMGGTAAFRSSRLATVPRYSLTPFSTPPLSNII